MQPTTTITIMSTTSRQNVAGSPHSGFNFAQVVCSLTTFVLICQQTVQFSKCLTINVQYTKYYITFYDKVFDV